MIKLQFSTIVLPINMKMLIVFQHELKPEVSMQRQVINTVRCFRRALELDDTSTKLWIEYGCLAYELHSFASRQIKQVHVVPY